MTHSLKMQGSKCGIEFALFKVITADIVTSGGAHLRGAALGLHSSEQTSQRWRAVGDTVTI